MFDDRERAALGLRRLFFSRAWSKRCPQCGEGELFRAFARLHGECGVCGLRFRREHGAQTGAMYLTATITELFAAGLALALFFFTDLGTLPALALGATVVIAFSYLVLPIAMALWTAVEYSTDVSNGEPWATPRR